MFPQMMCLKSLRKCCDLNVAISLEKKSSLCYNDSAKLVEYFSGVFSKGEVYLFCHTCTFEFDKNANSTCADVMTHHT